MQIKLVIWDLDDTFWKGRLTENQVQMIPYHIDLIKELVNRGIMQSIVSKNNFDEAMKVLKDWNIDEYFIFPKISWNPKGETIQKLLIECGLRAENTLFIDDDEHNLAEAKFYNKNLRCVLPKYLQENNILDMEDFIGKEDIEHSRLKQYKILEKKMEKKKDYASNEDFLRSSNIKIAVGFDCLKNVDRIDELIQRTNQLNFTKERIEKKELIDILENKSIETAYITAKDNFGDYGIIGFYAMKNNRLIHFLFSCRTIGIGIESYIYKKLGCPQLNIIGEVAVNLDANKSIDWIKECDCNIISNKNKGGGIIQI